MRNHSFLLALALILVFSACSKFTRLQKSTDVNEKFAGAVAYYEKKDYYRAGVLLEEVIPLMRGTEQSERAQFYRAYCSYYQRDLYLSSYQFKSFVETYPRSILTEEAYFMYCLSLLESSSDYNLDQASTNEAILAITQFLTNYPDNVNREKMVGYLEEMNTKLMKKDWENARLYYKTFRYKAAVIALDNFLKTYPEGPYTEEAMFTKVLTHYHYAKNSIDEKKKERYQALVDSYLDYIDKFPTGKNSKEAERYFQVAQRRLLDNNASEELSSSK